VAKDYLYDFDVSRSIVVDIRYAIFVMHKVDRADRLIEEMTIQ
jgi:hypothetical protein